MSWRIGKNSNISIIPIMSPTFIYLGGMTSNIIVQMTATSWTLDLMTSGPKLVHEHIATSFLKVYCKSLIMLECLKYFIRVNEHVFYTPSTCLSLFKPVWNLFSANPRRDERDRRRLDPGWARARRQDLASGHWDPEAEGLPQPLGPRKASGMKISPCWGYNSIRMFNGSWESLKGGGWALGTKL